LVNSSVMHPAEEGFPSKRLRGMISSNHSVRSGQRWASEKSMKERVAPESMRALMGRGE
jgi:hypothetical protein